MRQILAINADQRDVGALVRADHAGLELALVRQLHHHFVSAVNHVRIGEYVPIGVDDEPRAEAVRFLLAGLTGHAAVGARKESAEHVERRVVFRDVGHLRSARIRPNRGGGADVNDAGTLLLDQIGEIGQHCSHALGERSTRQHGGDYKVADTHCVSDLAHGLTLCSERVMAKT